MRTHYTNKQIEVNNWVNEIGFQTEMEKVFGKYCADIYIPELNWIVELDGFGHWPKKDAIRDKYLYDNFNIGYIFHVNYEKAAKEIFIKLFTMEIERKYGKKEDIEKRNITNKEFFF